MTFPSNYMTAYGIICDAYLKACVIGQGQTPSSEQLAGGMNSLNRMVGIKQTKGLKLWTNTDLAVTLTAGTNLYTFGSAGTIVMTKPLRAPMGYFQDQNGIRRPVTGISRQEWITLSEVNQQGDINSYFVDKQRLTLNVYVWLTPDANAALGTLHLILQQQIENAVGMLDTIQFPVEWSQWLVWGLADQFTIGKPTPIIQRCAAEASRAEDILEGWDVEDAGTFFTVDTQGGGNDGFR